MANNPNDPQKYLEYELIKIRGKVEKHLTERGSVSIDARTAEINNKQTETTKILYELAGEENEERDLLFKEVKTLGLKPNKKIGLDKLKEKLLEFRTDLITRATELKIEFDKDVTNIELQTKVKEVSK